MSLSLYDISVPVFIRGFDSLSGFLEKGRAYASERGLAPEELLNARLFEDMGPLTAQIQRASDAAKFTVVRVGQIENVAMEDNEASFDDLQARIATTIAFLKAAPANCMEGREEAEVLLKGPNGSVPFTGRSYMQDFAVPNFYFHVTTAYAILRHKGVPIGKMDFLGWS